MVEYSSDCVFPTNNMNIIKNNIVAVVVFLTKLFLFFIFFFTINRIVYLAYHYDKISNESLKNILLTNLKGLPLDISTTCYFLMLTTILIIINKIVNKKFVVQLINGIIFFLIGFCVLIHVVDISLMASWGTKINEKALSYLSVPKTMFDAIAGINYLVLIAILLTQTIVFIFIYNKYFRLKASFNFTWKQSLIFLPILFTIFVGMRGGITGNTIGKSSAIYCDNATLNFSVINGFWNCSKVLMNPSNEEQLYNYFPLDQAELNFKNNTSKKDTTIQILKNNRPNIIIILLESFNANSMIGFGGKENTTPFLDSLSKSGIIFTNFYSTGTRTEQGFVAILSGFPSQPKFSIQRESGKIFNLPLITRELSNYHYNMDFYYGGDLKYARTDEYLNYGQFENLYSKDDFGDEDKNENGVYDEYLFNTMVKNNNLKKEPFFSMALTSCTHGPFYYHHKVFDGNSTNSEYNNALRYTDDCLKDFMHKAKLTDWYKNTLFVILADHTHGAIGEYQYDEPNRFKIPLILVGDVIKDEYQGMNYEKPASQIDLVATLLAQLNLPHEKFEFSKNLFNPYENNFAYYTFDNGFGFIDKTDIIVYNHDNKLINTRFSSSKIDSTKLDFGKSVLQILMQRFADME